MTFLRNSGIKSVQCGPAEFIGKQMSTVGILVARSLGLPPYSNLKNQDSKSFKVSNLKQKKFQNAIQLPTVGIEPTTFAF